jgi:hypothetical protein
VQQVLEELQDRQGQQGEQQVLHCRDYLLLTLVPVLLAAQYPGVNRD